VQVLLVYFTTVQASLTAAHWPKRLANVIFLFALEALSKDEIRRFQVLC